MADTPEQIRRHEFERWRKGNEFVEGLIHRLQVTKEACANRYMEVHHPEAVEIRHFTAASTECIFLYAEGYFVSTVMVTQAVAEGIRRFVLEFNGIKLDEKMKVPRIVTLLVKYGIISKKCANRIKRRADLKAPAVVRFLVKKKIITKKCAQAFDRIWGSFRNDVHHMNPKVATIPFRELAKRNIQDLAIIEREIVALKFGKDGALIRPKPQYW